MADLGIKKAFFDKTAAVKDKIKAKIEDGKLQTKLGSMEAKDKYVEIKDLAEDKISQQLITDFYKADKPVAFVCHAPGVLRHVQIDGEYLVNGKKVTGFTNTEEEAVQLTDVVPFLVEDMLKQNGGEYSKVEDWQPYAVVDGKLITGQNPASSEKVAEELLKML